jgi:putative ABC transport system permease protein
MYFATFILKNLTRRRVRSVLTILGLSVAVGTMIALLGISHNVERAVAEAFDRRDVDLVVIAGGVTDQLSSDIDQSLVDKVRAMPGVAGVDEAMVGLVEVPRGTGNISVMLLGWPPENTAYDHMRMLSGRKLTAADGGKAILGTTVAQNLNKDVGDTIELQGEPFEVAGVFETFSVFENGAIVVLLKEAQRLAAREGRITGFSVRVHKTTDDPAAEVDAVRRQIESLTDATGRPARLSAQPTRDYVETASHIQITRAMVWMVSVIAVVIGVISMLNTMVMSVLERTQEIGILRAVGWPKGRVVRMVLGEAVALGVAAALVGTVGAAIGTHALSQFPRVSGFIEGGIPVIVVLQGITVAAVIGLIGGAYPAIRAARLLPTEAIRHD